MKLGRRDAADRAPRAEDFSEGAIHKAVLAQTLEHPATLLPVALSLVAGAYAALISFDPASFGVLLGGLLTGAGAWVTNYFFRGETFARRYIDRLRHRRHQVSQEEIRRLEADCEASGLAEGAKQVRELGEAHATLAAFLGAQSEERGGHGAQRLALLAEDTYREGLSVIRIALDTQRAVAAVDRAKLEREAALWSEQIATLGGDPSQAATVAALEKRLAGHRRRLALVDERAGSVATLIAESEELEAVLESTYLELVDLSSSSGLNVQGDAGSALERAVTAAQRVEERLRNQARSEARPEDEIYLDAGERTG